MIVRATAQHARNLATFAFLYKLGMLVQRQVGGKEGRLDSFVAGLVGGYAVFGRSKNAVKQQIVTYVFARVLLALAALLAARGGSTAGGTMLRRSGWPVFATLSWASVMYLFRWHPESLQPSLRSSMHYM